MKIFVSYNRVNQRAVETMVDALRSLDHEIWFDRSLHLGQDWWKAILDQIEHADALLLALSPEFLASKACTAERLYAARLGKPLLPVKVAPVNDAVLPGELAYLHVLDYVRPTDKSAIELVRGVRGLPPAGPLPQPPPPRPAAPLSNYIDLRDRICGGPLAKTDQFAIIAELILGTRSDDPEERQVAHELLVDSGRSQHLWVPPDRLLRDELAKLGNGLPTVQIAHPPDSSPEPAPPPPAPTPWLAIIGVAVGSLGLANLAFLVGLYDLALTIGGWTRESERPFGFVTVNFLLAVAGGVLCLLTRRRHPPSAWLGAAVCALSALFAVLDALKVGLIG